MAIFFTADHHFGHANAIRYDNRPFADTEEMNQTMIQRWNEAVKETDSVYHLGDISMLRPETTRDILNKLNGKIYLIRGNHDKSAEHVLCKDRFEWIKDYHLLSLNGGIKIAMMHYAMRVWDRRHYGSWHLFGHSHGRLEIPGNELAIDIGVDSWEFRPVSLDTLRGAMVQRGWSPADKVKKKLEGH